MLTKEEKIALATRIRLGETMAGGTTCRTRLDWVVCLGTTVGLWQHGTTDEFYAYIEFEDGVRGDPYGIGARAPYIDNAVLKWLEM